MAHLHNPKGIENGWYMNTTDGDLRCGFMLFKAGAARMVTARERIKCGRGFELSLENGKLAGPFTTKSEAEAGKSAPKAKKEAPKPEPAPEPVAEEKAPEPAPEPEAESADTMATAEGEPVVSSEGEGEEATKKKRRRRRKSED